MILSKMVCLYRVESQMESHSGCAKLALFGQQAAHGTTVLHPILSGPAHTAATHPLPMQTISYPPSMTHTLTQHSSKANKADDLSPQQLQHNRLPLLVEIGLCPASRGTKHHAMHH